MNDHPQPLGPLKARWLAARAWVYGYPALVMDRSRALFTAEGGLAPNQVVHLQDVPDHTFRAVVRPNQDTLYSSAMLDLSDGPLVLHLPEVPERRFVMFCLLDAWTNAFAARGTRSSASAAVRDGSRGCDAQTVVLVGPDDASPEAPEGAELVRCPTNGVWLLGRVELLGQGDLPRAREVQSQVVLERLDGAALPPPTTEPEDSGRQPGEEVLAMAPERFYAELCRVLAEQPPPARDAAVLRSFAALGLVPGAKTGPERHRRALEHGARVGRWTLTSAKALMSARPGWGPGAKVPLGDYGDRYLVRAVVARVGFGANRREDAVYLNAARDRRGRRLDGSRARYLLRFAPGGLPPVHAFWSISLYDGDGFFVPNAIGRHVLGSHGVLALAADGSLELHIQGDRPADGHWLPAPDGPFELTMRMYWPDEALVAGRWTPPRLHRVPL